MYVTYVNKEINNAAEKKTVYRKKKYRTEQALPCVDRWSHRHQNLTNLDQPLLQSKRSELR